MLHRTEIFFFLFNLWNFHICILYLDHSLSLRPVPSPLNTAPSQFRVLSLFQYNLLSPISVASMHMDVGPSAGVWKKDSSSSSNQQLPITPQPRSGVSSLHARMLTGSCLCVGPQLLWAGMCGSHAMSRISFSLPTASSSCSDILSTHDALWTLGKGKVIQVSHLELSTQQWLILSTWFSYESIYQPQYTKK